MCCRAGIELVVERVELVSGLCPAVARIDPDVLVNLGGILCEVNAAPEEAVARHLRVEPVKEQRVQVLWLGPMQQERLIELAIS